MQTTTRPAKDSHDAVGFSSAEWGALKTHERGQALRCTRETAATGADVARRLRRKARHRLNRGAQPHDVGPTVLVCDEAGARGQVWIPE